MQSSQTHDVDLTGDLQSQSYPRLNSLFMLSVGLTSQLLLEKCAIEVALCLTSDHWSKPVFTVGLVRFREHGFSSA